MGHCYHHALSSVRKWGGIADDHIALHSWLDESKSITADFRHRALRHHPAPALDGPGAADPQAGGPVCRAGQRGGLTSTTRHHSQPSKARPQRRAFAFRVT